METSLRRFHISYDRRTLPNDTASFWHGPFVNIPLIPPKPTAAAMYTLPGLQPRWILGQEKGLRAANTTANGTVPALPTITSSQIASTVSPTPTVTTSPAWLESLEGPFRSVGRNAYFWDESLSVENGTRRLCSKKTSLTRRAPIPPLDNWGRLTGPRHSFRFSLLSTGGGYTIPGAGSFATRNLLAIWHDPLNSQSSITAMKRDVGLIDKIYGAPGKDEPEYLTTPLSLAQWYAVGQH